MTNNKNELNELVKDDSRYGDKKRKKHGLAPYKRQRSKINLEDYDDDNDDNTGDGEEPFES